MSRVAVLLVAVLSGCGYTYVRKQCPTCTVIEKGVPPAPVPPGTRTIVLLVEGLLGFGWEWDEPRAVLAKATATAMQVFHWSPWSPLGRLTADLATAVNLLIAQAPPSVRQLIVFGHSAGGLLTAFAADRLLVRPGLKVNIVNIGAPYAGMHTTPVDGADHRWTTFGLAMGGTFTRYPQPASGVTVESWVTHWPGDPVMRPRFGHDPGDPAVGPPGVRRPAPAHADHNHILGPIVEDVMKRLQK